MYAALLPDRTEVIIKVQRPNIEKTIETDLGTLAGLAQMAQERLPAAAALDPVGIVREFSESLRGELDTGSRSATPNASGPTSPRKVHLHAEIYWEYTTRHVEARNASAASRSTTIPH